MTTQRKIRMRRATADRLLAELLKRCEAVNAGDFYLYRVVSVCVFGSYLTDKPTLGDLDIVLEYEQNLKPNEDTESWSARANMFAKTHAPPSVLEDFTRALYYPERSFKRFIRGNSGRVHISPSFVLHAEIDGHGVPYSVVWKAK